MTASVFAHLTGRAAPKADQTGSKAAASEAKPRNDEANTTRGDTVRRFSDHVDDVKGKDEGKKLSDEAASGEFPGRPIARGETARQSAYAIPNEIGESNSGVSVDHSQERHPDAQIAFSDSPLEIVATDAIVRKGEAASSGETVVLPAEAIEVAALTSARGQSEAQANPMSQSARPTPSITVGVGPRGAIAVEGSQAVQNTLASLETPVETEHASRVEAKAADPMRGSQATTISIAPGTVETRTMQATDLSGLAAASGAETREPVSAAGPNIVALRDAPAPGAQPHPSGTQAQAVIGQIVLGAGRANERKVEIRLDPPELGRVQIQLNPGERGLTAIVMAERPETGDMLRRNADDLARALSEAGYEDVTLEFSAGDSDADLDREAEQTLSLADATEDAAEGTPAQQDARELDGGPIRTAEHGLDIRI